MANAHVGDIDILAHWDRLKVQNLRRTQYHYSAVDRIAGMTLLEYGGYRIIVQSTYIVVHCSTL